MQRQEAQEALSRIERESDHIRRRQGRLTTRLAELAVDAEAIRRSWEILGDGVPLQSESESNSATGGNGVGSPRTFADAQKAAERRGELIRSIRAMIERFPPEFEFNSDHVRKMLVKHCPGIESQTQKSSIAVTLRQLHTNKEIARTHKGRGRAFSRYKRILKESTEQQQEQEPAVF